MLVSHKHSVAPTLTGAKQQLQCEARFRTHLMPRSEGGDLFIQVLNPSDFVLIPFTVETGLSSRQPVSIATRIKTDRSLRNLFAAAGVAALALTIALTCSRSSA